MNCGAGKKILFLCGDFAEDYEVMCPYQMLLMIGCEVDTVAPGKVAGDTIATSIHDFEGFATYTEKRGHNFAITADFENLDLSTYHGLYIPGGRAPEYIRLNKKVLEVVRHFSENGKPIAAVCHGPLVLVAAGVLKGVSATCYPACGPDISLAGGTHVETEMHLAYVDEASKIVTSPAWPGHPDLMKKFMALVLGE